MAAIDELNKPKRKYTTPGGLFPYNDDRGQGSLYAGVGAPAAPPVAPLAQPVVSATAKAPLRSTPGGLFPYNDPRGERSLYASPPAEPPMLVDAAAPQIPTEEQSAGATPSATTSIPAIAAGFVPAAKAATASDVTTPAAAAPFADTNVGAGIKATTDYLQRIPGAVQSLFTSAQAEPATPAPVTTGTTAPGGLPPVNPQTDVQRGGATSAPMVEPTPVPGLPNAPGGIYRNGNSFGDSPEAAAAMLARPAGLSPQNQAAFDAIGDRANAESVGRVQAAANKATYDQQVADAKAANEQETRLRGSKEAVAALNTQQANQLANAKLGQDAQRVSQEGARLGILSAQQQLAQTKDNREAVRSGFDVRSAQRLEALQNTIMDPKATPEAKQAASNALLMAQGKSPDDYQIVHAAGGQTTDPTTGLPIKQPDRLVRFSKRTGQYEEIGAAPTGQMPAVPADKAALVKGTTYQTARGPATWDGKQFVPATGK